MVHAGPLGKPDSSGPEQHRVQSGVPETDADQPGEYEKGKRESFPPYLEQRPSYQVQALIKDLKTDGPVPERMNEKPSDRGLTAAGAWFLEPGYLYGQSPGPHAERGSPDQFTGTSPLSSTGQ